jgi:hypothetical protein
MFGRLAFRITPSSLATLLAVVCLLATGPAQACRLALVLGFDVSRSVDNRAYRLQVDGIIAALRDPEVRALLLDSSDPVALAIFEWAGQYEQQLIADWSMLDSTTDIDALVRSVQSHQRRHNGLTAIGSALTYARALLDRAPDCLWHTIDMAGDGEINNGPQPRRIYDTTDFGDTVVNGLAIGGHESQIEHWFRRNVLHGPGAFVEFSPTHEDFAEAFRRKLIRELTEVMLSDATPLPPHN